MTIEQSVSLFLIISGAFVSPFLSNILKIPVVTGEIIIGIILGPTILNIVSQSLFVKFLAEFGFFLLMFYIGLEIEIEHLSKKLIISNIIAFIINIIISYFIISILSLNIFWLFILVSVSVGITVGALKELNIINSNEGKIIMYSGIIQEFIIIALVTSFEIYKKGGYSTIKSIEIVASIVMAILFFKLVRLLYWWYPKNFDYFLSSDNDPLSLRMRFVLTVMLLSVSFAFYFHIDPIVGAFISGFVVAISFGNVERIKKDVEIVGLGFFIPVFFVYIGVNTKITPSEIPYALIVTALLVVSHLGNIIIFYIHNSSIKEAFFKSLSLAKGLSIVVLIATIAKASGIIDQKMFSQAILAGILSEIIYTTIFKLWYKKSIQKKDYI